MTVARYRMTGLNHEVSAVQVDRGNVKSVGRWLGLNPTRPRDSKKTLISIPTERGRTKVHSGDWIIRRDNGTLKVMNKWSFEENFERVKEPDAEVSDDGDIHPDPSRGVPADAGDARVHHTLV